MTHLEEELIVLKADITEMWQMVTSQLFKTREALINLDKDLAREVLSTEKRINALELKIDRDCENIVALFNPVAVDLRTVLAILKINNNLERSGDIAEGIAKYIIFATQQFDQELIESTKILRMYELTIGMLEDVLKAFETEDTRLARSIFKCDELVDAINISATGIVADFIRMYPAKAEEGIYLISMIRKLERIGDHCKNMAEEIIFNFEAKVLKHKSKKRKEQ